MELESELRLGTDAGVRALLDPGVWLALGRRTLSPPGLAQVVAAVLLAVATGWAGATGSRWIAWIALSAAAIWLWPLVLRWFVTDVARQAIGATGEQDAVPPQEVPPAGTWRRWWAPALARSALMAPAARLGYGVSALPALAVFAAVVWLATPALVRSVLAGWFPPERIEQTLHAERLRWTVLAAFWCIVWSVLHGIVLGLAGLDGATLVEDAKSAWSSSHMVAFLVGQALLTLVLTAAIAIFCIAAAAHMAAGRLQDAAAGEALPDSRLEPQAFEASSPGPRAATRGMLTMLGVVVALVLLWPVLRRPVLLGVLGVDRQTVQMQRTLYACEGATFRLRVLHWAGVDATRDDDSRALACAAINGQLSAVKLLLDLGESPTEPVVDPRFDGGPRLRLSPLAQALQSDKGLRAAELMLVRVTDPAILRKGGDGPDAVQAAAMSHCMSCVEWAVRHHAPVDGTWQSTPMTLWLDSAGRATHSVADLEHLAALGLSPTALGQDRRSALHAAAKNGDLDAVEWLLGAGAHPAVVDIDGNTPLLDAAGLLGRGPDGNACGQDSPGDLERVRVVQRLLAVTPTTEHGSWSPFQHLLAADPVPTRTGAVDYQRATRQYEALQPTSGPTLDELTQQ